MLPKWLEGVAYALEVRPDTELEERADKVIEIIEKAQQDDGYLNTFFTIKEPEHRWQNLQECHELYCAGHMMEAAAAYYEVTGKRPSASCDGAYGRTYRETFRNRRRQRTGHPRTSGN